MPDDRRTLTDADLELIRQTTRCPHGMSQEDVYELRSFLRWWKETKTAVGGALLRLVVWVAVILAAVAAYLVRPGDR